jgi:integrase/recombinase XerD
VSFLSRQVRLESGESIVVVVDEDFDPHAEAGAYLKWLQYGAGRCPGTARTYGSRVAAYLTWAERSGIDWRCPTLDQLADLVRWLHRGGRGVDITPRTAGYVNLGLTAIGGFLRFCALHGSVPAEVADRLSEPRFLRHLPRGFDPGESGNRIVRRSMLRMKTRARPPKFLTAGQQAAVIAAARQIRDRFLAELLFGAGLRVGEACGLHRQDMHFLPDSAPLGCRIAGPHLHVVRREDNINGALAKSGCRRVPVSASLARLYADYQQERWRLLGDATEDSPFVFVNLYRSPLGAAMRPGSVEELFERLSRDTGIKATPHTCRHTFATRLVRAGVDRDVVQELLGHASPMSTAIYTHADWPDLQAAVAAIDPGRREADAT